MLARPDLTDIVSWSVHALDHKERELAEDRSCNMFPFALIEIRVLLQPSKRKKERNR